MRIVITKKNWRRTRNKKTGKGDDRTKANHPFLLALRVWSEDGDN